MKNLQFRIHTLPRSDVDYMVFPQRPELVERWLIASGLSHQASLADFLGRAKNAAREVLRIKGIRTIHLRQGV